MSTRIKRTAIVAAMLIAACATATGCSARRAPTLVAEAGLAVARSIGQVSDATTALQKASVLSPAQALRVQETLLAANERLKPLPGILRAIDAAQQSGGRSAQADIDLALAILRAVGVDLTTALAGVPVGETTRALLALVEAAQASVSTVLVEVARLKE